MARLAAPAPPRPTIPRGAARGRPSSAGALGPANGRLPPEVTQTLFLARTLLPAACSTLATP